MKTAWTAAAVGMMCAAMGCAGAADAPASDPGPNDPMSAPMAPGSAGDAGDASPEGGAAVAARDASPEGAATRTTETPDAGAAPSADAMAVLDMDTGARTDAQVGPATDAGGLEVDAARPDAGVSEVDAAPAAPDAGQDRGAPPPAVDSGTSTPPPGIPISGCTAESCSPSYYRCFVNVVEKNGAGQLTAYTFCAPEDAKGAMLCATAADCFAPTNVCTPGTGASYGLSTCTVPGA
jgi:hypothetical protein